jgi:2-hydroxy-3-keto-5-methylthiopentenyl-1-phosphate phosphatase
VSVVIEHRQPVIFSDFDGTITERDVIQMIMEAFAPPVWKDIVAQILDARTLSIKDGVTQLFDLLPGSLHDDIVAFVKENVRFRPGFPEFLTFCQAKGIPFNVVSGGVDFFIEPVLAPYRDRLTLYCNRARMTPERIELSFPYGATDCEPCNQCACCKIGILDRYSPETHYRIGIGDSITDLGMSRRADWTFARSRLIDYTAEAGIPTTPFETFYDIQAALEAKLTEVPLGSPRS